MIHHFLRICLITLLAAAVPACDTDDEELYFIGDSMIARWDLDQTLTSFVTRNLGVSGAGIKYVESLRGTQAGHDVVMMIGTNDLGAYTGQEWADNYARRYVDAIKGLDAAHVYLYSILPREFGDVAKYNMAIPETNARIKALVASDKTITYIDVYDVFLSGGHIDYELYSDGLHLSPEGYEILANALRRVL